MRYDLDLEADLTHLEVAHVYSGNSGDVTLLRSSQRFPMLASLDETSKSVILWAMVRNEKDSSQTRLWQKHQLRNMNGGRRRLRQRPRRRRLRRPFTYYYSLATTVIVTLEEPEKALSFRDSTVAVIV